MADRTLTVTLTGDARSVLQAMSDVEGKAGGLGQSLKRVGEIAAGFITAQVMTTATNAVKNFVSGSIAAASSLSESINAVQQIFGESSDRILTWGKQNATSFGLSQRAFNEMATPMGAVLKNLGFAQDEVADQTINLTKRAADMASVFNTDVSDALAAINSALRGEANPIERYGVSVNQAAVNLRALADSGKTSAAQLTENEKAAARLAIIFDQTTDVAGDFQNTSDGLANSQRILQARTEELQAKLGTMLLPAMAAVTSEAITMVEKIDELVDSFDEFGRALDVVALGPAKEMLRAGRDLNDRWNDLGEATGELIFGLFGMNDAQRAARASTANLALQYSDAVQSMRAFEAKANEATAAVENSASAVNEYERALVQLAPRQIAAAAATNIYILAMSGELGLRNALIETTRRQIMDAVAQIKAIEAYTEGLLFAGGAIEKTTEKTRSLGGASVSAASGVKEITDAVREAERVMAEAESRASSLASQFGRLGDQIRQQQAGTVQDLLRQGVDPAAAVALAAEQAASARRQRQDQVVAAINAGTIDVATGQRALDAMRSGTPDPVLQALGLVPGFASGGMVPGPVGVPRLAIVHGGEEVRTPAQQRGGDTYVFNLYGSLIHERELEDVIARAVANRAGAGGFRGVPGFGGA